MKAMKADGTRDYTKIPVTAFGSGNAFKYLAGSSAFFPWNDMGRPDVQREVVFLLQPGPSWAGDAMGARLVEVLDEFVNDKARATKPGVQFQAEKCAHGTAYAFLSEGAELFRIEPGPNWMDGLAEYISQEIAEAPVAAGYQEEEKMEQDERDENPPEGTSVTHDSGCPFCAGKTGTLRVNDHGGGSTVICDGCGARGPLKWNHKSAIAGWKKDDRKPQPLWCRRCEKEHGRSTFDAKRRPVTVQLPKGFNPRCEVS